MGEENVQNNVQQIEVRAFSFLKRVFDERKLTQPLKIEWPKPAPARLLIEKLRLNPEEIEAIFLNGAARHLEDVIYPGDRVALVPPGTPGPYRVLLGFVARKAEQ